MKLRTAEIDDLEVLNLISVKSKAFWGYSKTLMEMWSNELTLDIDTLSKQNVLIIETENSVIGFSSIMEKRDTCEIIHLWILPDFIGKGFGKILLDKTIETCIKADKPIIVVADPNAETFYESQGFVTFDKVESSPKGRFLPVMKKQ